MKFEVQRQKLTRKVRSIVQKHRITERERDLTREHFLTPHLNPTTAV